MTVCASVYWDCSLCMLVESGNGLRVQTVSTTVSLRFSDL